MRVSVSLLIFGSCLLVAAAAAAIVEGHASDAEMRGGSLALALTLAAAAALVTTIEAMGYIRSPHWTEGAASQGHELDSEPQPDR